MKLVERLRTKPPTYEDAVAAADEIERLREALDEISFRIDNLPKGMTFKPQDPLFDLIRTKIKIALQQKDTE